MSRPERLIVTLAEAAYHHRGGRLVADEPDQWDVEYARDLLGNGSNEVVGRRLAGDEGCDLSQGGLLLGEFTQTILGLFRHRDVAQRAADEDRLGLDLAKRQLHRKLAAVRAHASQLHPASEHAPFAGLHEASEGGDVALAKGRRHDQLGHCPP